MWKKLSSEKKRRLSYDAISQWNPTIDVDDFHSPEKTNSAKKLRLPLSCGKSEDWNRRLDGFADVDWHQRPNTAYKRKGTNKKNNVPRLVDEKASVSQSVDIDGYSSEEDCLTDVKPLVPSTPLKGHKLLIGSRKEHVSDIVDTCSPDKASADGMNQQASRPIPRFLSKRKTIVSSTCVKLPMHGYQSEEDEKILDIEDQSLQDQMEPSSSSASPVISQLSSKSCSPALDTGTTLKKASDWMKGLQWQAVTPEKLDNQEEACNAGDSARKKKTKYMRGGLADRLQKLISREKSAVTFWQHKLKHGFHEDSQGSKKYLDVKILSNFLENDILVTKCIVTPFVNPSHDETEPRNEEKTVLFTRQVSQQFALRNGTTVRLHPPWQRLKLPCNDEEVILCTNFCQVISHDPNEAEVFGKKSPKYIAQEFKTVAVWRCPCVTGGCSNYLQCPAHIHPLDTAVPGTSTTLKTGAKHLAGYTQPSTEKGHNLQCISNTPTTSQVLESQSILESIERRGGSSAVGVSFQAVVQRVCCKRAPANIGSGSGIRKSTQLQNCDLRYSLLVQDCYGGVCDIQLPPGCSAREDWREVIAAGEGRLWQFHSLRVLQRLHQNRAVGLFSLINSIWRPETFSPPYASSQDSQQSGGSNLMAKPPGFCYSLTAEQGESQCSVLPPGGSCTSLYSCARIYTLAQLPTAGRVTCLCRVIFALPQAKSVAVWHVTDLSISGENCPCKLVSCSSVLYLPDEVEKQLQNCNPTILCLKDAQIENGKLLLDGCSRVYLLNSCNIPGWQPDRQSTELLLGTRCSPPDLTVAGRLTENMLVTITGCVCGVDESTAFSWLECDVCGSDQLVGGSATNPFLLCPTCQKAVVNPSTKMRLDVRLKVHDWEVKVSPKIKLLQDTIEKLLPKEAEEEGHELSSVLGKPVGPLTCLLVTVTKDRAQQMMDLLLQEVKIWT